jgi:hypothetical protein
MFSLVPLLATETMIPMPTRITTPITIQVVSTFLRAPSFQSAAKTTADQDREPDEITCLPIS